MSKSMSKSMSSKMYLSMFHRMISRRNEQCIVYVVLVSVIMYLYITF